MKNVVIIMMIFILLFSCASTTYIKSIPAGAKVYHNENLLGKTPLIIKDTKIGGTSKYIQLKLDGYNNFNTLIIKDEVDIGAIIGGFFFLIPFLWWGKYQNQYNFELEKK